MASPCTFTLDARVIEKLKWLVDNSHIKTNKSELIRNLIEARYLKEKELRDAQ